MSSQILEFTVVKLDRKAASTSSWDSFHKLKVQVPLGTTYQNIILAYCDAKDFGFDSCRVYEGTDKAEVVLKDCPTQSCHLAVFFTNLRKASTGKVPSAAVGTYPVSEPAKPNVSDMKMEIDEVDNVTGTHSCASNQVPEHTRPPLHEPTHVNRPHYDANSPIYPIIDEYLGESKREGCIKGSKVTGHVDHKFMTQAMETGSAVGYLDLPDSFGTCTLFASADRKKFAILTNHHVLPSRDMATCATIIMDHTDEDTDREQRFSFTLAPEVMFFFSVEEELDYAFVAVDPTVELAQRYALSLADISEGVARFEGVNLIGHPKGGVRAYSIRGENILMDKVEGPSLRFSKLNEILRHGAYTSGGS